MPARFLAVWTALLLMLVTGPVRAAGFVDAAERYVTLPDRITREALEDTATVGRVDHRRMNDDAVDLGRRKDPREMWHHPGEGRKRIERCLLGRDRVTGGAEQPTAAGIDEARLLRLRTQRGQQAIKQAAIDRAHVAVEVAGRMDDGIDLWQSSCPRFG